MGSDYLGKPCPKCAYVRTAADTAPDWQCPKCEIVYAKFGQAAPTALTREVDLTRESPGLAKLAHLSTLANLFFPPLGTIVPIALWVVKSGEDELTVDSAKEALNFQISTLLWALAILLPVFVFPPFVYVAWLALLVLVIAGIALPIVATMRVADGTRYYYPYTWHLFGEGPVAA